MSGRRGGLQGTKGIAPKQRETGEVPVDWERGDIVATMGALEAIRRELEIDGSICNVHDLFWGKGASEGQSNRGSEEFAGCSSGGRWRSVTSLTFQVM